MAKETRTILGSTPLRSVYAKLLGERCFPHEIELGTRIAALNMSSVKILDFAIQMGNLSCRAVRPDGANIGVRLRVPTMSDGEWAALIDLLSEKAFFASQLLAGELPADIAKLASANGVPLIPNTRPLLEIDGVEQLELNDVAAALFLRFSLALEDNPGQYLFFRGKSAEELIAELRRMRLTQTAERRKPTAITELAYPAAPRIEESIDSFWDMSPAIREIRYTIKADELPASILKWLAPIPLSGLEDKIDFVVEEGYARVARLAQSFGLGL